MELESGHAFAATCHGAKSCWEGTWADGMYGAWKKQIFNASSWNTGACGTGLLRAQGCGHAVASLGHFCCGKSLIRLLGGCFVDDLLLAGAHQTINENPH